MRQQTATTEIYLDNTLLFSSSFTFDDQEERVGELDVDMIEIHQTANCYYTGDSTYTSEPLYSFSIDLDITYQSSWVGKTLSFQNFYIDGKAYDFSITLTNQ